MLVNAGNAAKHALAEPQHRKNHDVGEGYPGERYQQAHLLMTHLRPAQGWLFGQPSE